MTWFFFFKENEILFIHHRAGCLGRSWHCSFDASVIGAALRIRNSLWFLLHDGKMFFFSSQYLVSLHRGCFWIDNLTSFKRNTVSFSATSSILFTDGCNDWWDCFMFCLTYSPLTHFWSLIQDITKKGCTNRGQVLEDFDFRVVCSSGENLNELTTLWVMFEHIFEKDWSKPAGQKVELVYYNKKWARKIDDSGLRTAFAAHKANCSKK